MALLWTFSDLHQEWLENLWDPQAMAPARADAIVAAGDVCMPLTRSITWIADRFGGAPIVFVPGNHEFWRGADDRFSYQDQVSWARDLAAAKGVNLLIDGDTACIGGVRFVGATLWTDFGVRPDLMPLGGAIAEARRGMNDYRRIRFGGNRSRDRLEPRDTIALHRRARAAIEGVLDRPHAGPTVVVTHHAPSPASLPDPWFELGWCYASDLTPMIERTKPALWIHGHVHGRVDIKIGETRILANARGHADEPSAKVFDPSYVVRA